MVADWITFALIFGLGLIPVPRLVARAQGLRDLRLVGSGEVTSDAVAEHLSWLPAGLLSYVAEFFMGFLAVALTKLTTVWDLTEFLSERFSLPTFQIVGHHRAWIALWVLMLARKGNGVLMLAGGLTLLAPIPTLIGAGVAALYTLAKKDFKSGRLLGLGASFAIYVMLSQNDWVTTFFFLSMTTVLIRHSAHLDQCLEA